MSTPSRSRAPFAIAAATSAETAPCSASTLRRYPEQLLLDLVVVRDDAAVEDVARARDRGEPCRDEASRARLRRAEGEPARSAALEHELLHRSLVTSEEVLRERLRERRLERIRARLGAGLDDEIDVDLEVTRADRRLDAVTVAARVGECLRDRGLADAVEPQDAPLWRRGALEHLRERRRGDRAWPEALELPGRPGQDDDDAAARVENDAGGGARNAERLGSLRQRRLLAHARSEIGVRASHALREAARDLLDLGLERGVDLELAPRDARDELDRPVVVRRPEPTRDQADVGLESLSQGRFQIGGVVTDDRDPDRLEPEPECLLGIEGAVEVGSLAAHELAARDDYRGARALQREDGIVRCPFFGTATRAPATRTTTLRGEANESVSLLVANRFVWPRSSVPR